MESTRVYKYFVVDTIYYRHTKKKRKKKTGPKQRRQGALNNTRAGSTMGKVANEVHEWERSSMHMYKRRR